VANDKAHGSDSIFNNLIMEMLNSVPGTLVKHINKKYFLGIYEFNLNDILLGSSINFILLFLF
jgi:hypothetical protein